MYPKKNNFMDVFHFFNPRGPIWDTYHLSILYCAVLLLLFGVTRVDNIEQQQNKNKRKENKEGMKGEKEKEKKKKKRRKKNHSMDKLKGSKTSRSRATRTRWT